MKNRKKQTPDNAFREALEENIQGSRHAIKFIVQFVSALLKVRTSNLVKIANAFETEVDKDSVYRHGEENIYIAGTRAKIARFRLSQGNYTKAQTEAELALAIQRKLLPPNHLNTVSPLCVLGNALTKQNQPQRGEPFLRQALDIARQNYKSESWQYGNIESQLGESLLAQNARAEAEPLLRESYEKLKAGVGEKHSLTQGARKRIEQLDRN